MLGSQARGRHLVQALPPVFTLQCITGKVDKNKQTPILFSVAILLNRHVTDCRAAPILLAIFF